MSFRVQILETPGQLQSVEQLQRAVWPDSETDIVPTHLLITAAHSGGLVLGAFEGERLIGFAFGFPGLSSDEGGPRVRHCSHMLGVHPEYRDRGVGFLLKRAQWQMVRHQGLELITWTFDPLRSRNAHLNIAKLGGICRLYLREVYGEMRDQLNRGIPSDRVQVEWWVNTARVMERLSKRPRRKLDLAHYLDAGAEVINATQVDARGHPVPPDVQPGIDDRSGAVLMVEIPAAFAVMKGSDPDLALAWREHTRDLFETLFEHGYLITDFVYLPGKHPRSFYVLSDGESTLGA